MMATADDATTAHVLDIVNTQREYFEKKGIDVDVFHELNEDEKPTCEDDVWSLEFDGITEMTFATLYDIQGFLRAVKLGIEIAERR